MLLAIYIYNLIACGYVISATLDMPLLAATTNVKKCRAPLFSTGAR